MFLKLRIIFTLLSAICAAAVIPLGAFLGFIWAAIAIIAAFTFYVFMLIFKQKQEELEQKNQPQEQPQMKNEENLE